MSLQMALRQVTKTLAFRVPRKIKSKTDPESCVHLLWYAHTILLCKKMIIFINMVGM